MADEMYIAVPADTPFDQIRKAANKQARRRKARIGYFEVGGRSLDCVREMGLPRPDLLWKAGFTDGELKKKASEDPKENSEKDWNLARNIFYLEDLPMDPPPWALIDPEGNWVEEEAVIRKIKKSMTQEERKRFKDLEKKTEGSRRVFTNIADAIDDLASWIMIIEEENPENNDLVRKFFKVYQHCLGMKAMLPVRKYYCLENRISDEALADLSGMYKENQIAAGKVEEILFQQLNALGYQKIIEKCEPYIEDYIKWTDSIKNLYVDFLKSLTKANPKAIVVAGECD